MISVIVPVYGVEKYLDRCVESVLNQTYKDFELLLVDDGSLDNCPLMCDEWAKKDERIRVFHKPNGGLSSARNYGLDRVKGDYVAFVDSDDFVHPDYLNLLYSAITQANADISICHYIIFKENDKIDIEKESIGIIEEHDNVTVFQKYEEYKEVNLVVAWNKLYKKEIFNDIRFPNGAIHEDEGTYYKCLYKAQKTAIIRNPLYYYFYNNDGISKKPFFSNNLVRIRFYIEKADFFKKKGNIDERFITLVDMSYKQAINEFYSLALENVSFDFKNDKTSKETRKKLKKILKKYKVYPLSCTYLNLYEFYFGKNNIILKTRYFFYKLKNWLKLKKARK